MKKIFSTIIVLFIVFTLTAQNKKPVKATHSGKITNYRFVSSLADQIKNGTFIPADNTPRKGNPKRQGANKTIPGKGFPKGIDPLVEKQINSIKKQGRAPIVVFDADIAQAGVSDPTGAVGPNHYIGGWNFAFRIFDKQGNPLVPEASLATIFPGNSIGDPIILYDAPADRFIITEFDGSPNGFNIAVCAGSDPVNDGWHVYTTNFQTGAFPDYTKFSIWSDGYYVTANIGNNNRVFVAERDKMINGQVPKFVALPLPDIATSGFYSPQVFNVGNQTMPASGNATVVYMQDDAWAGVLQDHLKLWTINVDWNNTANSTISQPFQINTSAFTSVFDGGSFNNLPQPNDGASVDAMQATIMNQAQFRKFATHNSAVFNFVVDVNSDPNIKKAAIRWFELRQANDSDPWTLYQEGTYTAPDNKHAWAASMAMDNQGSIGMAYTSMGGTNDQRIAINYTGRLSGDTLGTMSVLEELIAQSSQNSPGVRYADYTHLTIDPSDDQTFWHISEYFNPNRMDVVGSFSISANSDNDTGVISIDAPDTGILSNVEQVTVTINNYGNFLQLSVPLTLQVDGITIANETFFGGLAPNATAQYTFSTTVDLSTIGQTYTLTANTDLATDSNRLNDTFSKDVTHTAPAAVDDINLENIDFIVSSLDNNQFQFSMQTTEITDRLTFSVHNLLGQTLVSNQLENENGGYNYNLDMSYATPGVYIVRLGNSKYGKSKKIIVK
jgi:hypothetical protein